MAIDYKSKASEIVNDSKFDCLEFDHHIAIQRTFNIYNEMLDDQEFEIEDVQPSCTAHEFSYIVGDMCQDDYNIIYSVAEKIIKKHYKDELKTLKKRFKSLK